MIYFVGAGSGAPDLITVRGAKLISHADVIVWAGSLVNPELLSGIKKECAVYDSAKMTLEETNDILVKADREGKLCVRLHTGDPCLYGAIREQMEQLDKCGVTYCVVPGVSSFCGAAAALHAEYTVPGVSQTVIISRMEGRTPVPEKEKIRNLASHGSSMVLFLSSGMIGALVSELKAGGVYTDDTPAAVVYKATWDDEKIVRGTLGTIAKQSADAGISKTALVLVGGFLGSEYKNSCLYDKNFTTGFRNAKLPFESVHIVCFSEQGKKLSSLIAEKFRTQYSTKTVTVTECFGAHKTDLNSWCKSAFDEAHETNNENAASVSGHAHVLVVFVGAAGIAVRTIAPYLKSKTTDPAVVSIDDGAHFVIPLASGHLGSANDASSAIAAMTGAQAAVTTSTDVNGAWAVDSWAVHHNMIVANPEKIKAVSSSALAGAQIVIESSVPVSDELKHDVRCKILCMDDKEKSSAEAQNVHAEKPAVVITYKSSVIKKNDSHRDDNSTAKEPLVLIPRAVVLGVGCKKDVPAEELYSFTRSTLEKADVDIRAVCAVASIDIKKEEHAVIELAKKLGVPFVTFSAEELNKIKGDFSSSEFVKTTTGTDNVCERAAVAACAAIDDNSVSSAASAESLVIRKQTGSGMTLAAAVRTIV